MEKILSLILLGLSLNLIAQDKSLPLLKISENKRYIITQDNQPFFWLGDTAWELFHRLNKEETLVYLENRAEKGFTVIQAVALAELDGLKTPNAYGNLPLINLDPMQPNENYFKHVDDILDEAEKRGLYIGFLPTWGDKFNKKWGDGPEIFTPENATAYGEWLAKRYINQNNIIWILGGDRMPENAEDKAIIEAMASGIRKIDQKHLITYHPWAGVLATDFFNETWLDLDMFQSGHDRDTKDYEFVYKSYKVNPKRPVINGEPRYENHPNKFKPETHGWMDDSDVRVSAYWSILSGAAGYTYGTHDIWQMYATGRNPVNGARTNWNESIHLPGSRQLTYFKNLLMSFPWQEMKNDQSLILNENPKDSSFIMSAIGTKQDFIIAYTPMGKTMLVDLSKMKAEKVNAYWFNPRDGSSTFIGEFSTAEKPEFKPWSIGRGSDFLLILIDVKASYQLPH